MNVAELKQSLESAPDESTVMVRMATGEMCPVTSLHVGAGGDAAGQVMMECGPQNSDVAEEPEDEPMGEGMEDTVDALAKKSGVFGGKKAKAPAAAMADEDEME